MTADALHNDPVVTLCGGDETSRVRWYRDKPATVIVRTAGLLSAAFVGGVNWHYYRDRGWVVAGERSAVV